MKRKSYQLQTVSVPKYKYSFNDKTYELSVSSSLDNKLGIVRVKQNSFTLPDKSKSNNLTLDKLVTYPKMESQLGKLLVKNIKHDLKLPSLNKRAFLNPENKREHTAIKINTDKNYYQSKVQRSIQNRQNNYLISLCKQHFIQTIEALRVGKAFKISAPMKQLKLHKKNPKFKTVFLDLDETLIHCDEQSNNYTIKLNFPVEGGSYIAAGIRVRPYCNEFLKELSSFAEIIIFTASSSSYADVVLDYLDPHKKYFAHRLYRQHCTLEKGYYTKDLRIANRRLEDSVLVDNSAFSFMIQPENGIPVLPFYHFSKDKQLLSLLSFLKILLECDDVRVLIKQFFFWQKYLKSQQEPLKIFGVNYKIEKQSNK